MRRQPRVRTMPGLDVFGTGSPLVRVTDLWHYRSLHGRLTTSMESRTDAFPSRLLVDKVVSSLPMYRVT